MARKMKDSGIEWIGKIPTDFSLYKLKYLLSSPLCYGANESGTLYSDILPRYIRITDISPNGTLKNSGMLSLDESSAQNYMLHEGDILFARSGATVGKSFIYHNYYGRAAYAGYLIKASFNRLVLPEFVYYYTCSSAYEIWKNSIFIQSTIQNIGADRYSNLPISVPNSIDKQLRIVRYLNNFCSKFDAIIYNLQTSIEDYKKLKQAVITQAVTKGVRGEREMKDSGVEWIGEIPREWNKCKLKNISIDIGDGLHGTPKFDDSGEVYFINGNNFSSEYVEPKFDTKKLCLEESLNYPKPELTEQTIMISLNGSYGKVCLYRYFPMLLGKSAGYITLLPSINRRYVRYYLSSTPAQIIMTLSLNGTTIPNLSLNTLYNFPTILPSASEQAEIADYLDAKCVEIDGLIAKKEQLVKELESYKKSLIYEVVTGKREV